MSVRPPVLFLFISRRVFCLNLVLCCPFGRLQLFAVRASVISVSRVFGCYKCLAVCSAVTNVWPCVRLLEVFGRVFGCYKSWVCVGLLEVFGRVFGCFLVVGRVFGCYKSLAVCSAVTSVGRFKCWSVSVLLFSSCFYLYAFLPVSGFAHSFYLSRLLFPRGTFRFVHACFFFLGHFVVLPIFYYCWALFMYSLLFYILCVLILLCFRRDFCFLLFPSYSRNLFLPRRVFVLFSYSRGFSFLFYAMRFSFTSP